MMWALAMMAGLIAAPTPEWLPPPPVRPTPSTLVSASEDGGLGVLVQGHRILTWDLVTGRRKLTRRLPRARWRRLLVAPRTDGEAERALVLADGRVTLVHLGSGRHIGDWRVPVADRDAPLPPSAWAVDGGRVALAGWELPGLIPGQTTPVVWIDAETGAVVSELRLPERTPMLGMAALPDGSAVIATDRHLVLLGPGPRDARTISLECDALIGAGRAGIAVLAKGAVALVDPDSSTKAHLFGRIRAPLALEAAEMLPGGRWAVARSRGAVTAIDLATRTVHTLSDSALGSPVAVLPSLHGLTVIGKRRGLRLNLTAGPPAGLALTELCVSGDCDRGQGEWIDLVSKRRYRGAFRGGRPAGQGVMHFEDGTIYHGPFVKGRPHGRGRVITAEGDEREVTAEQGEITPFR